MSRRLAAAGAWLAAFLAGSIWLGLNLSVRTDLSSFMPRGAGLEERLLLSELREGSASRTMLVALPAESPEALARRSRSVAERLRSSDAFLRVSNGDRVLDDDERELLFAHRYLLSPSVSAERFSAQALATALRARLRELKSAFSTFERRRIASDPTDELGALARAWRPPGEPGRTGGVWSTGDGSLALLVVRTRAPGFELDAQQGAIEAVHQAFRESVAPGAATDRGIILSGPGVFAVASRETIRSESRVLAIAAGMAAVLILAVSFRSARVVVLAGIPLAAAVMCATIVVDLVFDGIHGITIAFGATVLGVVVDYPIHLFSHLRGVGPSASRIELVWPTLRLSALTTATGYLAMYGASFPGLQELAAFAIVGLLAAAAGTRWGLPVFLPATSSPGSMERSRRGLVGWYAHGRFNGDMMRIAVLVLGAGAIVLLVFRPAVWEDDIAALSPIPSTVFAAHGELRAQLGIPDVNHLAVVRGHDAQAVLEASEAIAPSLARLIGEGAVGGFDHPARYLPSVRAQILRRGTLPTQVELRRRLEAALDGLPFRADAFTPFLDAVERARTQAPVRPEDLADTTLGGRIGASLFAGADGWSALINFSQVVDPAGLEQRIAELGRDDLTYLDVKRDTSRLMGRFRAQALARVGLGLAVIAVVLSLGLRSVRRAAMTTLPGLLAIAFTAALLGLLGHRLTLFHLVSMLLVLGLSIDYSLFFARAGRDRELRRRTFHGLLVCAATTVSVFAILSTSALPVLDAIGATVAIGAAASFIAAMALGSDIVR